MDTTEPSETALAMGDFNTTGFNTSDPTSSTSASLPRHQNPQPTATNSNAIPDDMRHVYAIVSSLEPLDQSDCRQRTVSTPATSTANTPDNAVVHSDTIHTTSTNCHNEKGKGRMAPGSSLDDMITGRPYGSNLLSVVLAAQEALEENINSGDGPRSFKRREQKTQVAGTTATSSSREVDTIAAGSCSKKGKGKQAASPHPEGASDATTRTLLDAVVQNVTDIKLRWNPSKRLPDPGLSAPGTSVSGSQRDITPSAVNPMTPDDTTTGTSWDATIVANTLRLPHWRPCKRLPDPNLGTRGASSGSQNKPFTPVNAATQGALSASSYGASSRPRATNGSKRHSYGADGYVQGSGLPTLVEVSEAPIVRGRRASAIPRPANRRSASHG